MPAQRGRVFSCRRFGTGFPSPGDGVEKGLAQRLRALSPESPLDGDAARDLVRDALAAVYSDMERRVIERFRDRGDTQATRDFASKVLAPYADACTIARIPYDMTADIERMAANA